jgi:hypothetical protein
LPDRLGVDAISHATAQAAACDGSGRISHAPKTLHQQLRPPGRCHPDVEDPLFTLGEPVGSTPEESIPIPPAVRRAGRHEEREFKAGRTVFAESGCLACHKIGEIGNPGPGQNLTHVSARLSSREIEEALVSPRAPMPSFKHLLANELRDLVRFLSLLR